MTGTSNSFVAGIGVNQTWQVVTRVSGTTYYNTTGKPIQISYRQGGSVATTTVAIDGVTALNNTTISGVLLSALVIIPVGASYVYTSTSGINANPVELR